MLNIIIHFIIIWIVLFLLFLLYDKIFDEIDVNQRLKDTTWVSFIIVLIVGLICDLIGTFYQEEKYEEISQVESLYAIRDSSETTGSIHGGFLFVAGSFYGETNTELTVRYVSGDNENGYKIQSLNAESNNITFVESNEDPKLEIVEHRHMVRSDPPTIIKDFSFLSQLTKEFTWYNNEYNNYTTYRFIVPEGTIVYDYNIDLE